MTQQLSLFADSSGQQKAIADIAQAAKLDFEGNTLDEVFAVTRRFRSSVEYIDLLNFLARFPQYSILNGFLLYVQKPTISFLATPRTWVRQYRRYPKDGAQPLILLAPMSPVRFVFDIADTEGDPVSELSVQKSSAFARLDQKMYATLIANCAVQGIALGEIRLSHDTAGSAVRITPAIRKKYKDLKIRKDARYLILLNAVEPRSKKFADLVHELGHIFCGHLGIDRQAWWPERQGLDSEQEEIEADSVAYLACNRKGMSELAAGYLARYQTHTEQMPTFSIGGIFQAVSYIEEMGKSKWDRPRKRSRY